MRYHPGHDRMVVSDTSAPAHGSVPAFALPFEVVKDPSLSVAEKTAILSEWASELSAVESWPTLRRLRGTTFPVTFSSIVDARERLDELVARGSLEETEDEQLGRVVVASFARSRRNDGVPQ